MRSGCGWAQGGRELVSGSQACTIITIITIISIIIIFFFFIIIILILIIIIIFFFIIILIFIRIICILLQILICILMFRFRERRKAFVKAELGSHVREDTPDIGESAPPNKGMTLHGAENMMVSCCSTGGRGFWITVGRCGNPWPSGGHGWPTTGMVGTFCHGLSVGCRRFREYLFFSQGRR